MTSITKELLVAYRAAHFHVFAKLPFVLRIDEYSKELAALHEAVGVICSAFITAYNVCGVQCADDQNIDAQERLLASIEKTGMASVEGEGKDPEGIWPGEPSLLVLGCAARQAEEWGRLYQQNVIVLCGDSVMPDLVVL